jgi:hypothetical protein
MRMPVMFGLRSESDGPTRQERSFGGPVGAAVEGGFLEPGRDLRKIIGARR